jgi:hypothetical protein
MNKYHIASTQYTIAILSSRLKPEGYPVLLNKKVSDRLYTLRAADPGAPQ